MTSPQRARTLRLAKPPVDSEYHWCRVLNLAYINEEDALFEWLREVRRYVEEQEEERRRRDVA